MGTTFSMCSLFYALLLCIVFFSKKRLDNLENNLYKRLIIVSLIEVVCAIGCYYTILYKDFIPILNEIVSRSLLVCYIVWITIFTEYTFVISYKYRIGNFKPLLTKFNLFGLLLILIMIFLPIEFHNENSIVYSYGLSTMFCFFSGGFCIILCLIASFSNYHEIKSKKYIRSKQNKNNIK